MTAKSETAARAFLNAERLLPEVSPGEELLNLLTGGWYRWRVSTAVLKLTGAASLQNKLSQHAMQT